MIISEKAIVLNTFPYSDNSLISRIYTRNEGKISIICKGAWKTKNPMGVMLEPMNHINIHYYNKNTRSIQIVSNIEIIQPFSHFNNELNKLVIGQIIVDLLDKTTIENNPSPILYRLCYKVLEKLSQTETNPINLINFYIYQLALRLGFMPNIKYCNLCNSNIDVYFIDKNIYKIICKKCITSNSIELNYSAISILNDLTSLHLNELYNNKYNKNDLILIFKILKTFIDTHLDGVKNVKSINLIFKLIK